MKLIMENWRKYLSESMKTADDFVKNLSMYVVIEPGEEASGVEKSFLVYYADNEKGGFIGWKSEIQGEIRLEPVQLGPDYPCEDAYMVAYSDATKGWGPLLYDVAMEFATMTKGGLVSDRSIVSDEAYAVWDHYLKNRSGPKCTPATTAAHKLKDTECVDGSADVSYAQLDNEEGELTKGLKADDCLQNSTYDHLAKSNGDWVDNPLSKLYRKEPTTIKALGDRFVTIGFKLPS